MQDLTDSGTAVNLGQSRLLEGGDQGGVPWSRVPPVSSCSPCCAPRLWRSQPVPPPQSPTGAGHWKWQSPLPSGGWLSDTSFIGADGWAVSGSGDVLHTTDGGATWDTLPTGENDALYAVQFISPTEGWVAGDWGSVLHTTDGGATWARQVSGTLDTIMKIDFADAEHGWLIGYTSVTRHDRRRRHLDPAARR